jgi:formylglycine-generating enzyme required for sulfatase activity
MLRDKLLASPLSEVPGIIAELEPYRRWADPLLRQAHTEAKEVGNPQKQLNSALALLPVDDTHLPYLKDWMLRAEARDIPVLRQSLAPHKDTLIAECWRVLNKPEPEDRGKALQAASALAYYDPSNPLWKEACIDVANRLVAEDAYVAARWIDALRPVANQLRIPLNAVFDDDKRVESERTLAASALGEYVSDQPDELAELLMRATEKQFTALYPHVQRRSEQTAPLLQVELSKKLSVGANEGWERFYKKQTNATIALIRMGRLERSWPLLKHSPDPSLRSFLIHSLGHLRVEPGLLIARLDQESDVSIRRALILCLGEYEQGQLSRNERDGLTTKLLDLYRNDPDPGIHGAVDWVLRQWQNEKQIKAIDKDLGKLPLPTLRVEQDAVSSLENRHGWYVNSQGQTMVIVRVPIEFDMWGEREIQHRERIGHSFAISTKEVTFEQFQRFRKADARQVYVLTSPMNSVSWYDAAAYCNWLSKREGLPEDQWCYGPNEKGDYAEGMRLMSDPDKREGYRLPTGAEWEYSCRAGAVTEYSFGEPWELLEKYGWYLKNSLDGTHPVGSLKPNDLGLFDLHGNLWEWCQNGDETSRECSFIIVSESIPRLLRGGSFGGYPADVRTAANARAAPSSRHSGDGFRISRTYPSPRPPRSTFPRQSPMPR